MSQKVEDSPSKSTRKRIVTIGRDNPPKQNYNNTQSRTQNTRMGFNDEKITIVVAIVSLVSPFIVETYVNINTENVEPLVTFAEIKSCVVGAGINVDDNDMVKSTLQLYKSLVVSTECKEKGSNSIIIIGKDYDALRNLTKCIQKLNQFEEKETLSSGLPYEVFEEKMKNMIYESRNKRSCPKRTFFVEIDQSDSSYQQLETEEKTYRDLIEGATDDSYPIFIPTREPIRDYLFILLYKTFDSLIGGTNNPSTSSQDMKELRLREYVTKGWTQRYYHRLRNKIFLV